MQLNYSLGLLWTALFIRILQETLSLHLKRKSLLLKFFSLYPLNSKKLWNLCVLGLFCFISTTSLGLIVSLCPSQITRAISMKFKCSKNVYCHSGFCTFSDRPSLDLIFYLLLLPLYQSKKHVS